MAQKVFWSWQDDDLTFDLNRRFLGIMDSGVYRGFDAALAAGLTLNLIHTNSGGIETKKDQTLTPRFGVIVTKQGATIREDDAITVPIESNGPYNQPRIDLVYLEHQYVDVVGGLAATYAVVRGVPADVPVAPSLPNPNIQVPIGELLLPAFAASLDAVGVVFTRYPNPAYAGDQNLMYTNRDQNVPGNKNFTSISGTGWTNAVYDPTNKWLTLALRANYYFIPAVPAMNDVNTGNSLYGELITINGDGNGPAYPMYFWNEQALWLNNTQDFICAGNRYVEPFEGFWAIQTQIHTLSNGLVSKWLIMKGGEAKNGGWNKFKATQSFDKGTVESIQTVGQLRLNKDGNLFDVDMSVTGSDPTDPYTLTRIETFQRPNFNSTGSEDGTVIRLQLIHPVPNQNIKIRHNQPAVGGFKAILTPVLGDIQVLSGAYITLVERAEGWKIVEVIDYYRNWFAFQNQLDTMKLNDLADVRVDTNNQQDDVLIYQASPSVPETERWTNKSILPIIRDRQHVFTKTQTWSGNIAAKIIPSTYPDALDTDGVIIIPKTGNHFILNILAGSSGVVYLPSQFTLLSTAVVSNPALTQTSNLSTIFQRIQKFQIGGSTFSGSVPNQIFPGDTYTVNVLGIDATVIAVIGDTPATITQKLALKVQSGIYPTGQGITASYTGTELTLTVKTAYSWVSSTVGVTTPYQKYTSVQFNSGDVSGNALIRIDRFLSGSDDGTLIAQVNMLSGTNSIPIPDAPAVAPPYTYAINSILLTSGPGARLTSIEDILFDDGSAVPVGTLLTFYVNSGETIDLDTLDHPYLYKRFDSKFWKHGQSYSDDPQDFSDSPDADEVKTGVALVHGDVITLEKRDGNVWVFLAHHSLYMRLIKALQEAVAALGDITGDAVSWNSLVDRPACYISAAGSINVPDGPSDYSFVISIPDQGTTNYQIKGAILSQGADGDFDNDVFWVYREKTTNSFRIWLRKIASSAMNIRFEWAIVRFT